MIVSNLDEIVLQRTMQRAIQASKYPMSTDISKTTDAVTDTVNRLAMTDPGTGHNNFLSGIICVFDLTLTKLAWSEWQRYHHQQIVSSQSTMHRITRFDIEQQTNEYVTQQTIDHMTELVRLYNENPTLTNYRVVLYNAPLGFKLTALVVTNYLQLKTMYRQRRTHRLQEWQDLCDWMKTLPHSEWITGEENESDQG